MSNRTSHWAGRPRPRHGTRRRRVAMSNRISHWAARVMKAEWREPLAWTCAAAAALACFGLIYWSLVVRLGPATRDRQATKLEWSRATQQWADLRAQATPDLQRLAQTRWEAIRGRLFDQPEQVREWEAALRSRAEDLGLDLKVTLAAAPPLPAAEGGLTGTSAAVEISARDRDPSGAHRTPYERILEFAGSPAASARHCGLVELHARGKADSVVRVTAVWWLPGTPKEAK